jgi:hypothetical protein
MNPRQTFYRRSLLTGAALLAVIAIVLAAGVIPPVLSDTYAHAWPHRAAGAFAVLIGMNLCFAAIIGLMAVRPANRSRLVLWFTTLLLLLSAFGLADAAGAFAGHGAPLRAAVVLLWTCCVAELLAALSVLIAALLPLRQS